MKLQVKKFNKKNGDVGSSIKVRKLGPTGKGMAVGDVLKVELATEPALREISTKEGNTFTAVNVLGKWVDMPTEYQQYVHPDYGTLAFDFPSGKYILDKLRSVGKGDLLKLYLKEDTNQQGESYLTWAVDVESAQKKKEINQHQHVTEDEIPF